jgi:hypothetical protein
MDEKKFDTHYTEEIVCPYCGYEFTESYEFMLLDNGESEIECYECGKGFIAGAEPDVHYYTHKKERQEDD